MVHHWAHKPGSDCKYGTGMTEWHYKWILKHYQREGWEIEYTFGPFRFDCFHPQRKLVIEFQRRVLYDYMYEKSNACIKNGLKIIWILHNDIFKTFYLSDNMLKAGTKRRLLILDIISFLLQENRRNQVEFYYNRYKKKKEINELYKLTKTGFGFDDYYELKAKKHY